MTSQTHEQTGEVFVFNFGTHYSNVHLVIRNKLKYFNVEDWNSMY